MLALLPATATLVGLVVLRQIPRPLEVLGVTLVAAGIAVHRGHERRAGDVPGDHARGYDRTLHSLTERRRDRR